MADALAEALEALRARVGDERLDGSIRFEIADLGALRVDGEGARLDDGSDADCTISGELDTFRALFDGELSPTGAFMTGRIKIDGDMGVAMKIASLIG